jgi:hypothetical protein
MVWTLLLCLSAQVQDGAASAPAWEVTTAPVASPVEAGAPTPVEAGGPSLAVAWPVPAPVPAPAERGPAQQAIQKAGEFLLGIPYGAVALGLAGVAGIVALVAMTTEPGSYGVPEAWKGRDLDRAWAAFRLGAVFTTLAAALVAALLFLFPFSTVASWVGAR